MGDRATNLDESWHLESDPAQIAPIRLKIEQLCADGDFDRKSCDEIGLCVNEALANVIRHAYDNQPGKPIDIGVRVDEQQVRVSIRDWGKGLNPSDLPPPRRDPLKPGGLGLICLRQMMDSVVFTSQPDGMLLVMSRRKVRGSA